MSEELTIRKIAARPVMVPLDRPIRTAMGEIPAAPLVLIDVETDQGVTGRSYVFAYTRLALAPLARLVAEVGGELVGEAAAPVERMRGFDRRFRLLGWHGLIGMAVAGLDMAFWDALARAAGLPLAALLGGMPRPIQAYDSFGILDPARDEPAILASVAAGFQGIKIKIGGADLARDLADVAAVRSMIGPEVALMVDYNQSLDPPEARRRIDRLAAFDLTWVEEPVPAEDLAAHARVRAGSPVPVQTGENWWFPRAAADAIAAGASDHAMLDVMKIGGITGWLEAAALCRAACLPVSSHGFIEASAHLLAVTPTALWLEHLDKASPVLRRPLAAERGFVTARGPGLGFDWDEAAVARFLV
ncbi:MAG TPA: enolase C-terminal domain-like protein [Aliidongia sp.]|uniref:enolase C-terminal domain-like protein n=1 Tax=Aliidongia sp. TaxID=1914230 RepID=UPI002DDCC183|nr:enolase C-terminal domain-like protein [Aliidongia sp.]HEV2674223.1 enolase C-terminal domain-like protein [Aliidongia sp.]